MANRMRSGDYELIVHPPLRSITAGALMSYEAHHVYGTLGPNRDLVQWFVMNDNDRVREDGKRQVISRPHVGFYWRDYKWRNTGRYLVFGKISTTTGKDYGLVYEQWVEDADVVLGPEIDKIKKTGAAHPVATLADTMRYVQTLEAIAGKFGVPAGKRSEHDQRVQSLTEYYLKLTELISAHMTALVYPMAVSHLETETQRKTTLNVFLAKHNTKANTWRIVDWTNPVNPRMKYVFEETGTSDKDAIEKVIEAWDSGNSYFDGHLSYEVPKEACGEAIKGSFDTDGRSFWDEVSYWLDWLALGAAVVAGIVTLIAPVPGSRVVSALIWTSIFSSTAAAMINIGQRHEAGYGSWKDDAFDGLTIVGNIFAGAGMATQWVRGASLVTETAGGKVMTVTLVGQIGTDGIQGVLMAADTVRQMDAIEKDPNLTPEQRLNKFLALFASAAVAGTMTVVSIRATKADLDQMYRRPSHLQEPDARPAVEKLEDLKNPDLEVDLTKKPRTEGHTDEGGQTTKVQEENARLHADSPGKPPHVKYPDPPPPNSRGMRDIDHETFAAMSKEKGLWILVRDGNPEGVKYIGLPGYEGKPMSMKAKSATEGPRQGLASYHPEHERTRKTLAEDALFKDDPPMTPEQLKADPAEFQRRYDLWKKKNIIGKGYKVDEADHFTVYKEGTDDAGNPIKIKYHGDYDLHGVYKRDGTFVEETGKIRSEMNEEFGAELVRHGAHDEWEGRLSKDIGGENAGPQPPVTVYGPDGETLHIVDRPNFKKFYEDHNFDWEARYGKWEEEAGEVPPP